MTTMTHFQAEVLRWLAGSPRRVAGAMLYPSEVRRSARLAEEVYLLLVTA